MRSRLARQQSSSSQFFGQPIGWRTILSDSEFPTNSKFWTKVLKCTVPKRVHIIGTGAYRDLFDVLGPYLYFRVPIFGVLGPYLYFKGPDFQCLVLGYTVGKF